MKILVISNLYPPDMRGGYELGCFQAVEALRARGHDVRVLTSAAQAIPANDSSLSRSLKLVDAWSRYLFEKNAPITNYLAQSESLRISSQNNLALLTQIREFQPDVVYPWMLVGIGGIGLLATLMHLGIPWVWHLMDDVPLMLCRSDGFVVPQFAAEFSRRIRGHHIACSQQLVDEIERGGVCLGPHVDIVPNWVAGPLNRQNRFHGSDSRLRIVTAAGSIDRDSDKGIETLIEAAALLKSAGRSHFQITIFGRSTDGHASHLIHKYGLENVINLSGVVDQATLSDRFASADLFAFPTREREPFGFAPLEAMARGCVPLISQTCGIAEWFVHGVHLLKAERSAPAFAHAFSSILDGGVDLAAIAARGSRLVEREFHIEAIVPKIESALKKAIDRKPIPRGTPQEAYQLSLLAERLARVTIQEARCA